MPVLLIYTLSCRHARHVDVVTAATLIRHDAAIIAVRRH